MEILSVSLIVPHGPFLYCLWTGVASLQTIDVVIFFFMLRVGELNVVDGWSDDNRFIFVLHEFFEEFSVFGCFDVDRETWVLSH